MNTIPIVDVDDVRARVGAQSFKRGEHYFRDGAIFAPRRRGTTLQARCRGSSADSYGVEVTLDAGGIADAACSCPVGDGGYCKHVVALLLTWIDNPAAFVEAASIDAALERRSKAELIALVKHMLRREPELEALLETTLPTPGVDQGPVDPEVYRRQAAAAFRHAGDEWGREAGIADELMALVEIADAFAAQDEAANAVAVYRAVSDTVIEQSNMYEDENGELHGVIATCITGFGACLRATQDEALRAEILQALYGIYYFDVELGGVGLADEVPDLALNHTTAAEKQAMAGWLREALPQSAEWSRQQYGSLLLELEADTLDDDTFLQLCHEAGLTGRAVERLLERGRIDDAAGETQGANDYTLLDLADMFVAHGHGDVAERLVLERSRKSSDLRVLAWLKNAYAARGDRAAALDLARKIFRAAPSLDGYKDVQALAAALDRWEAVRPTLRMFLNESHQTTLLVEIYLYEGEIDHALEAVQSLARPRQAYDYYSYSFGNHLLLQVAHAAKETRPRAALEIFQREAEGLIAAQGRERYRTACSYLTEVRALYHRLGEDAAWTQYITGLREQNRRLRALMDELATAGL